MDWFITTNGLMMGLRIVTIFAVALCSIYTGTSFSAELQGRFSSSLEYNDNVRQRSTDTEDDYIQTVGLNMSLKEERKKFVSDFNFELKEEFYHNDTFDSETSVSTGFGLFSLNLVEQLLNWQASFTRTAVLTDSSAQNTPDNREYRNIFRTGPIVSYAFSRSADVKFSANYISVTNSNSRSEDTQRVDGSISLSTHYNSVTSFFADSRYEKIVEADESESQLNISSKVGATRLFANGEISASVGQRRLEPEELAKEKSEYFEARFSRRQFAWHDVSLSYLQDITDTAIGFTSDEQGADSEVVPLREASDTDFIRRKRLTALMEGNRASLRYVVRSFIERENYKVISRVERAKGIGLRIEPTFSALISPFIDYSYGRKSYGNDSGLGTERTRGYEVGVSYKVSQDVDVTGGVSFVKRTNKVNSVRDYEELSSQVAFVWRFL